MKVPSVNDYATHLYKYFTSHKEKISADIRSNLSGSGENFSDTLAISQAAQNFLKQQPYISASSNSDDSVVFDTNQGQKVLDINAYFSNKEKSSLLDGLPPLLLPTQNNIDALSKHISDTFPKFLEQNNIASAPSSIHFDSNGQIQLPSDYAYASELEQALQDNPAMSKKLSAVQALTSHFSGIQKSISFQQEYRAATTRTEADAAVARYHYLFSGNQRSETIALLFSEDGRLSLSSQDKP